MIFDQGFANESSLVENGNWPPGKFDQPYLTFEFFFLVWNRLVSRSDSAATDQIIPNRE